PRVQHLAELIRAGTDVANVVCAGKPQGQHPEQREYDAQRRVPRGWIATEADLEGQHRGNHGDHKIEHGHLAKVNPRPDARTGEIAPLPVTRSYGIVTHTRPSRPFRLASQPPTV